MTTRPASPTGARRASSRQASARTLDSVSRTESIDALRAIYRATGPSPCLYAWVHSEAVRAAALALAGERLPEWPLDGGRYSRLLRLLQRHVLLRGTTHLLAHLALGLLCLWLHATHAGGAGRRSRATSRPHRAFLIIGVDNEDQIREWRDRARPLATVFLGHPGTAGAATPDRASGGRAAALGMRTWRVLQRSFRHDALAPLPAIVRLAVSLNLLRRLPLFLATVQHLNALGARGLREVLATSLDEQTFAAGCWALESPANEFHWVQHGFLVLDRPSWIPGAVHHAYDPDHARFLSTLGAPPHASAPPIGLSYFRSASYAPTRTLLVATQTESIFDYALGRGMRPALTSIVEKALAAGWRVVQRLHRMERGAACVVPLAPGAVLDPGTEPLVECLLRERPAYLLSIFSTAALDGLAAGCVPLFLVSEARMSERILCDLRVFGRVLDPTQEGFDARVRELFRFPPSGARPAAHSDAAAGAFPL